VVGGRTTYCALHAQHPGASTNGRVTANEKATAERILAAVGTVAWVENEELLHAVTAVSGSGPAYFFLFLEAMTQAAVQQGLDPVTARQLAVQTAAGAARLAQSDDTDLAELRRRVTSPGGTTERAIAAFEQHHLRQTVDIAMQACANRSRELAELLGR
jgi:pyrroline-5-carboxylate reductase